MNIIVLIVVGACTGWLTGKAVEVEGRTTVVREGHIVDAIYGIIGAMIGEYLFSWIVIGPGNAFSGYATAVLGSITLVGGARQIGTGLRAFRRKSSENKHRDENLINGAASSG